MNASPKDVSCPTCQSPERKWCTQATDTTHVRVYWFHSAREEAFRVKQEQRTVEIPKGTQVRVVLDMRMTYTVEFDPDAWPGVHTLDELLATESRYMSEGDYLHSTLTQETTDLTVTAAQVKRLETP